jgi:predicted DNA-binding transcriptional regulator AlpA
MMGIKGAGTTMGVTRTTTKPGPRPRAVEPPARRPPPPLPPGCEALLGKAQLCAALGVSLRKLQGMLSAGEFPAADLRLGAHPRWRVATLNAWVEARCRPGEG